MPSGSRGRCWRRWGRGLLTHLQGAKEAVPLGQRRYSSGENVPSEQACFYVLTLFAEASGGTHPRMRTAAGQAATGRASAGRIPTFSGCIWALPELQVPDSRILVIGLLLIN